MTTERTKIAAEKRILVRKLLDAGKTGADTHRAVKKKFGSGISATLVAKIARERNRAEEDARVGFKIKSIGPLGQVTVERPREPDESPIPYERMDQIVGILDTHHVSRLVLEKRPSGWHAEMTELKSHTADF